MEEAQLLAKLCEMAKKLGKPARMLNTADIMAATGVGYHTARKIRVYLELGVWKCEE